MDKETKDITCIMIGMILAMILLIGSMHLVRSYWEAETYTRLTGKKVTTWDALWIEFRIQEQAKE